MVADRASLSPSALQRRPRCLAGPGEGPAGHLLRGGCDGGIGPTAWLPARPIFGRPRKGRRGLQSRDDHLGDTIAGGFFSRYSGYQFSGQVTSASGRFAPDVGRACTMTLTLNPLNNGVSVFGLQGVWPLAGTLQTQ
jgi:hypothetical protein